MYSTCGLLDLGPCFYIYYFIELLHNTVKVSECEFLFSGSATPQVHWPRASHQRGGQPHVTCTHHQWYDPSLPPLHPLTFTIVRSLRCL